MVIQPAFKEIVIRLYFLKGWCIKEFGYIFSNHHKRVLVCSSCASSHVFHNSGLDLPLSLISRASSLAALMLLARVLLTLLLHRGPGNILGGTVSECVEWFHKL